MEIRLLGPEDIELRVSTIRENGCSLLLYKNARVDMKILDETFGPTGWQRKHEVINENLFCTISIWDENKKQWIEKQDVGVESYTEKEKGQASDAFKRAGFNVGIGRELYTAPFIWISLNKDEIYENGKDNRGRIKYALKPSIHFRVKKIGYNDNREINQLSIVDNNGRTRFELGKVVTNKVDATATEHQMVEYIKLTKELTKLNKFDYSKFMKNLKIEDGVNNVAELPEKRMEYYLNLFRKQLEKSK